MTILAVAIALHALRYYGVLAGVWLGVDVGIRRTIEADPLAALTHMLIGPLALLLGPWQFMSGLRTRHRALHRWIGRAYVAACIVAGIGGLVTSFHASGGSVAGFGFGLLAVCWLATTTVAWRAAVAGRFDLHRMLMRFSYAMTFGAVTLRLQIPLGFALGYTSYSAMSVWLAYSAWLPNVAAVAVYTIWERRRTVRAFPA